MTVKLSLEDRSLKIYQEPSFSLLHSLSLLNVRIGIDLSPKTKQDEKQREEEEQNEEGMIVIESNDLDEPFIITSKSL